MTSPNRLLLTREEAFYLIYAHTLVFLPDLEVCEYQKSPFSVDRNVMVNFKPGEYMRKIFFSVSDTGGAEEQIQVVSTGVEPMNFRFLVERDTLLQSHRILLEAKTTKLGSCDKHLVYWYGCGNVDMCLCAVIEV